MWGKLEQMAKVLVQVQRLHMLAPAFVQESLEGRCNSCMWLLAVVPELPKEPKMAPLGQGRKCRLDTL